MKPWPSAMRTTSIPSMSAASASATQSRVTSERVRGVGCMAVPSRLRAGAF